MFLFFLYVSSPVVIFRCCRFPFLFFPSFFLFSFLFLSFSLLYLFQRDVNGFRTYIYLFLFLFLFISKVTRKGEEKKTLIKMHSEILKRSENNHTRKNTSEYANHSTVKISRFAFDPWRQKR